MSRNPRLAAEAAAQSKLMDDTRDGAADLAPGAMPGGASGAPEIALAEEASPAPAKTKSAEPIGSRRYRVRNGGFIVANGMRMVLKAGKEVDARHYDLKSLKRQGIVLEPIGEDDDVD